MKEHSTRRRATCFSVRRHVRWTLSKWKCAGDKSGRLEEKRQQVSMQAESKTSTRNSPRRSRTGQAAVWQARLIMLVMINIAQLWILAATIDAALAHHYSVLVPLVVASGLCFLITLTIIKWWRPTSRSKTSTGYVRSRAQD